MSSFRISREANEKVGVLRLDVSCRTEWGETLCVSASQPIFPEGMATSLVSGQDSYPQWRTGAAIFVPLPDGDAEKAVSDLSFRCFTRRENRIARWEDKEWNVALSSKDAGIVTNVAGDVATLVNNDSGLDWDTIAKEGVAAFRDRRGIKRNWSNVDVHIEEKGTESTLEYRVFAKDPQNKETVSSLWHDIPLYVNDAAGVRVPGMVNYVCEIPKATRRKFEIATTEEGNPIKQDTSKDGSLRSYKKGDIFFNYGALPRTWEDPKHVDPNVGAGGDNDPLDVCEIGLRMGRTGEPRAVKVLGVLCMIDAGEADWKVIAVDAEDPWAKELNDINDVERLLPGTLDSIREWWRTYKIPEGKAENKFGYDEKFLDRRFALEVINETHLAWERLVEKYGKKNPLSPDSAEN